VRIEIIPVTEKFQNLEAGQVQQRRSKTDNVVAGNYEASQHLDGRLLDTRIAVILSNKCTQPSLDPE
jgi:hypothetical protein